MLSELWLTIGYSQFYQGIDLARFSPGVTTLGGLNEELGSITGTAVPSGFGAIRMCKPDGSGRSGHLLGRIPAGLRSGDLRSVHYDATRGGRHSNMCDLRGLLQLQSTHKYLSARTGYATGCERCR